MTRWPGYQRFCSLARGLDLIGERWTLLIVQELSFKPARYNELRRLLPGIGSNILADRLRKLDIHDIIQRSPASVGQGVLYELTDRGRGLVPAIVELRKWGLDEQLMLAGRPDCATYDLSYGLPDEIELAETYQWEIDGTATTLRIDGTVLTQTPGPAKNPSVSMSTTRVWMKRLVSGDTDWYRGIENGDVILEGDAAALNRMLVATAQPGADLEELLQEDPSCGRP